MCEMIVRQLDKQPCEDAYDTIQQNRTGDVIALQLDGFAWTSRELSNPEWRLIKVPGVLATEFRPLLTPEMAVEPFADRRLIQRRQRRLDVAALIGGTFTAAQIHAATYTVEPAEDPSGWVQ